MKKTTTSKFGLLMAMVAILISSCSTNATFSKRYHSRGFNIAWGGGAAANNSPVKQTPKKVKAKSHGVAIAQNTENLTVQSVNSTENTAMEASTVTTAVVPNNIFNFGTFDNLSLIPLIPFIGFITVTLGFFYVAKVSNDKRSLISLIILGIVFFLVLLFGEFSEHYFAILFIPLLSLGILSINKIKTNFLPLLILSVVLFAFLSVIPVYRSYHFLLLLLPFSILNSIFLIEFLPKIFTKKSKGEKTI